MFQDYDRIAREVTLAFYKNVIGPEVEPKNLIPTARLVAEHADRVEGHRVLRRYLQGDVSGEYRLFLGAIDLSQSIEPSQTKDQLRAARARMLEALPRYQEALRAFLEADQDRDRAEIVATRMAGGIRDDASGLKLSAAGHAAAKQARGGARCGPRRAAPGSRRGGTTDLRSHAVGVSAPVFARSRRAGRRRRPPHTAASYSMREKRSIAPGRTSRICDSKMALVGTLFNDLNNNKENVSLVTQIKSIASQIMVLLRDTRTTLDAAPYPYEHGSGTVSIGTDFVPAVPGQEEFAELFGAAQGLVAKYYSLDYRLLSELIVLAERIETAIGLELLADPPEIPST